MKCPACSAENEKGDCFCGMCGSKLQVACPQCGVLSDPSRSFCGRCGTKLDKARDEAPAEARVPDIPVKSAGDWVSEFRDLGWDREVLWSSILKDLSKEIRPRSGEGVIFAGRSSLDLHIFLQGFDASDMLPAAAFMGTNQRLIVFSSRAGSTRLDPLLQIPYESLSGVEELKDTESRNGTREVDGLLRLSLQGKEEPVDVLVLNKKARAPLLRFLQTASSTCIDAPAEQPQTKVQPPPIHEKAKSTQGAATAASRRQPAPRWAEGVEVTVPPSGQERHSRALKIAATVLGVIGGVAGGIGATIAIVIGGIGSALGDIEGGSITHLGYAALGLAIVGAVGGAIAVPKPRLAGAFMLVSGIGGVIAVSLAYAFGGALLVVGGILALVGSRRTRTA